MLHQFCLDVHYYGEFDFFLDMCVMLQRTKSEYMASAEYQAMVETYCDKQYNPNLLKPRIDEPRKDKYEWALTEPAKGKRISISDMFKT